MNRVLLIGLDGADPALAARWMAEGRLPRLAALARRGHCGPLRSTMPPATFPAWTTCVTGVNPGRHGIFDFTEPVPGRRALRFVNSTFRRAPALWNILSDAGRRVGVLGVPGTHPPEAVNGFMVAGFDSPVAAGIDAGFVHPRELYPEAAGWRFADFQEGRTGPGWHDRAHRRLLENIADKEAVALRLLRREPWDFFMAVFGETDTVSHHFWMFHDPASPRHRAHPEHARAIRNVYERLDETVGRLADAAGPDTRVLVVSDHGFTGAGDGVAHVNNFLAEAGWLAFSGGGSTSLLKRAGLGLVPERWRGALFRRLRGLAAGAEGRSRFGGIDWSRTRAWSEELSYFPSVRLNPAADVTSPAERAAVVRELCALLESWGPVARALPRETVYAGPHTEAAPDILLVMAEEAGYPHTCLRARGGPSFRRMAPAEHGGGKERGMNGVHRDPGLLVCDGPVALSAPGLEDIAPTVLSLLGVAGPPMDGHDLFGGGGAAADGNAGVDSNAARAYTPGEERELERRLRDLGYLE